MKSHIAIVSSGLFASSLLWCQSANPDGFSPMERTIIKTLSPLPDLPVDTTNNYRDSPAAALLGQKLFFEPRLSRKTEQKPRRCRIFRRGVS